MKRKKWTFAQANSYYKDYEVDYLFLHSFTKESYVWDFHGGEWTLDGLGHSKFRLELLW